VAAPAALSQPATGLPTGMTFVAQDAAGSWGLYRIDERQAAVRLPTQLEPRQACVVPDGSKLVYSAADGTVRLTGAGAGDEAVLARADAKRSFTQPCMSADGREVYVVEMADGKSLETDILRYTSGAAEPARIARQPGAQHDPFVHQKRWLVYANVGCSDGCEELLVEIWVRDLLASKARQLTLLNALSQGPVTDGRRVVFSSNVSGTHQLWQVGVDGSGVRQLTHSSSNQAISPALCGGAVHFVRSGPEGATIARLAEGGQVVELPVPGLKSFRALRCL
jgi:Tol biopolymer transport system component